MKKNSAIQNIELRSKIYTLRQTQVMLDFDLAEIYGYEVRTLNQQVRRNIARFPEDFMFQLTREEVESVKSQFVTTPLTQIIFPSSHSAIQYHTPTLPSFAQKSC